MVDNRLPTLQHYAALQMSNDGFWIDENHLLQGPTAITRLVYPEASKQELIIPRNQILHSNAGPKKTPWYSIFKYWDRSDITGEPHFQVDMDGAIRQAIPLNRRADCNAKANAWTYQGQRYGAISYETQDDGADTLNQTPWTPEQLRSVVGAATALCVQYNMQCDTVTEWTDGGIDYHSKFKEWSIYVGKTCPGYARIQQVDWIRSQVASRVAAYHQKVAELKL